MSAIISSCGRYRYMLTRGESPDLCAFVMLNPSTADATQDDNTSRKTAGFARDWGYRSHALFNLYAGRATKPTDLWAMEDPVGPDNDVYLRIAATMPLIVVAWGKEAQQDRLKQVVPILRQNGARLFCLGVNKEGSPKHPLYVPYSQKLIPWLG